MGHLPEALRDRATDATLEALVSFALGAVLAFVAVFLGAAGLRGFLRSVFDMAQPLADRVLRIPIPIADFAYLAIPWEGDFPGSRPGSIPRESSAFPGNDVQAPARMRGLRAPEPPTGWAIR